MHQDARSLRAVECVAHLVKVLARDADSRVSEAVRHLAAWNGDMLPESVAATLFDVFFLHWARRVASERFAGETAAFLEGSSGGLAASLLRDDDAGWFSDGDRVEATRHRRSALRLRPVGTTEPDADRIGGGHG